jgi:nucleoside-diphosphate-sugar epimerase
MSGPATVLITGGAGNLGTKLAADLSQTDWCRRIILLDVVAPHTLPPKAEALVADLLDAKGGWRDAVAAAAGIVHFAALNPYPGASFAEAAASLEMTANLFLAGSRGAARIVFASSNHVMGRYKEEGIGPGQLTTDLPPLPGTRAISNGSLQDSPAYASAKLMGERLLKATASQPGSRVTGVSLRVGWCQPGENHPRTISADGNPIDTEPVGLSPEATRDLNWFRQMWLSNRDFCAVFTAALTADATDWPQPAPVLNAMSNNTGMPWDLTATRRTLGYAPQDDSSVELARAR